MVANKQLLTRQEAAESLSVSIRKLDLLIAAGDLPAVRIGAAVRVRPSAIDYLIEARESRGPKKGGTR
ncbi:helix-turn-helix domain-containing protein [Luteolibacter arcticus]|uniref:helix-turn-helix domain-containing protein n=1 Tax=Luteolibacter arcticus TaxID=1581411 RepID=UPI0034E0ACD4